MSRRKARELALQILFQEDLSGSDARDVLVSFWKSRSEGEPKKYAEELFKHAIENESLIEDLIRRFTKHWRLERIAAVDRNILRMAVAEFLFTETPNVVVIDEAIEIARKYGSEKSPEFVNGILDSIRQEIERSPNE
ncbi:MAG: transcription antitermination factor NusB [bacterium]